MGKRFYVRKFDSLGNDLKKNWKILNRLLGRNKVKTSDYFVIDGEKVRDPNIISKSFCSYFIEYPKGIHDSIPASEEDYLELIPFESISMRMVYSTEQEICRYIVCLKKNGKVDDI